MEITTQFFLKNATKIFLSSAVDTTVGGIVDAVPASMDAPDGAIFWVVGAVGWTGGVMIRAAIDLDVHKHPPWKMSNLLAANNGVNTP